ncbi:1-acyl-sn-glycerol-3-phosphate acyltransferase alpha-like [Athalia rosae]|uniref:1-acyl-sn-glycerol-3-phosphate acyltransferase alpha-like n=1 Tax=Athalia rosae TaxID=37344 RepID=UPI0020336FA4|nr:1-acyl-sn-glycerol-3-phosphate acyltransferase alpha-like [Athalia rosae]XP_020706538.2 1-acyl-sn-glycerol-3-phosphate acyltransferase alpha-like [Athalia rosae]
MITWLMYLLVTILFMIVLVLSSDSHDVIRFNVRFILYYLVSSIIALGSMPFILLRPKNVKNCRDLSVLLRQITKILGIEWELRGADELSIERGCIIVANHQTTLDILGMFNIWGVMGKCASVAKMEVFYAWPFGLAAWLAGVVFIDRRNSSKAVTTLNATSLLVKHEKTKMWIFPEGTRNKTVLKTGMLPFKKGAFRIAIENQVPILPVVFSPYYFINEKTRYFGRGKVIIHTLKPIFTDGLELKDVDDLIIRTRAVMLDAFEALTKEVLSPLPPDYPGQVL